MILLYSGHACKTDRPERVLASQSPGIMLTYFEMYKGNGGETKKRFLRHEKRRRKAKEKMKLERERNG